MTPLSPADRAALLGIARGALLHHLGLAPAPALPAAGPLAEPRAAFVTLHAGEELRGCIGTFSTALPLAATVARMAVAAACEDPRFPRVTAAEAPGLRVGVSALSPPRRLADPRAVAVGTEGLVVKLGWHRGTLLPKVAALHGWDAEAFLRHTCLKAGLHPTAWKDPGCEVEAFEAEEFEEPP